MLFCQAKQRRGRSSTDSYTLKWRVAAACVAAKFCGTAVSRRAPLLFQTLYDTILAKQAPGGIPVRENGGKYEIQKSCGAWFLPRPERLLRGRKILYGLQLLSVFSGSSAV